MNTIAVSDAEKRNRGLSPENLMRAVAAVNEDGYVVLTGVVDTAHLDVLRERMMADLETILAGADVPFNFNTGNVQQDPPPFAPYLFADILLNDIVIGVTKEILGPGLKNTFYSGNTALPHGTRQPVHPDAGHLWSGLAHATPAHNLVINVPVVDMSPENGATEIWPGTHRDTTYAIHEGSVPVSEALLDKYRSAGVPLQPAVARGGVIIRDMRMWHAGMPNHTEVPRPMIAMVHATSWWTEADPIIAPRSSEPFFRHPLLKTVVRYVDGDVDHTHAVRP